MDKDVYTSNRVFDGIRIDSKEMQEKTRAVVTRHLALVQAIEFTKQIEKAFNEPYKD